ncbi:unnamed protein product [Camellia sinensis]
MCQIDDEDDFVIGASAKFDSSLFSNDFNKYQEKYVVLRASVKLKNSTTCTRLKDAHNNGSDNCDDDMCQIDDEDDFVIGASAKFDSSLFSDDFNKPADIWSVGCTVIVVVTGKPSWSQQYQEVPALFHIGTTKSTPSVPEHLSAEAIDILLKFLQKEYQENYAVLRASEKNMATSEMELKKSVMCSTIYPEKFPGSVPQYGSYNCDDDMCEIDDEDVFVIGAPLIYGVLDVRLLRWLQESLLRASSIRRYVSALFHIGTTKSFPSIPEHLFAEAIDIFLKYLQKEPNLRLAASGLLLENMLKDVHNNVRCLTIYPENFPGSVPQWGSDNCDDDMCQIDDEDDFVIGASAKFDSALLSDNFNMPADICSVGCTVIEMVTGKPSWSQQYQEVPARFHIGTTKSTPSIPEYLSAEAIDILLKFMQKPAASDLLLYQENYAVLRASVREKNMATSEMGLKKSTTGMRLKDVHNSVRCSTIYPNKFPRSVRHWGSDNCDDGMCQIDDEDYFVIGALAKFDSALLSDNFNKPTDIWTVGCMVIEMVTGKPSWSQQYQEVPALFHIGTTKSTPSVPEHLSAEAIDSLLKFLQKRTKLKACCIRSIAGSIRKSMLCYALLFGSIQLKKIWQHRIDPVFRTTCTRLKDVHNNVRCLTIYHEKFPGSVPQWGSDNCDDDMCQIDDEDDFVIGASAKFDSSLFSDDFNKSPLIYGVLDVRLLRWLQESLLRASNIRRYVPALFHIGTTKSTPSVPEHLSAEAIDSLLKFLQKPAASDLLLEKNMATSEMELKKSVMCSTIYPEKFPGSVPQYGSYNCDDDMCEIDDEDVFVIGA